MSKIAAYANLKDAMIKNKKLINKVKITAIAMFVLTTATLAVTSNGVQADKASDLRRQINDLQTQIDENNARAAHLDGQADSLAAAIAQIDQQIKVLEQNIRLIQLKIQEIQIELEKTRAELEKQKEILKVSLRKHYTLGQVRTVELLVESESFSDFFDQQEYVDRIRSNIQTAAKEVQRLEEQLEQQEAEQKELLAQEEANKVEQQNVRAGKQKLLADTRGEEALYRARAAELNKQQANAEAELERYIQSLVNSGVSLGPVKQGEYIGQVGNTGYSTGPHLHHSIQHNGSFVNPDTVRNSKGWSWPVPGYTRVSQGYHSGHRAIDVPAPIGTGIVSVGDGEIIHRGCLSVGTIFANYAVLIRHPDGYVSRYIHMNPPAGSAYDACRANTYY